jgi:putative oxidoreductase
MFDRDAFQAEWTPRLLSIVRILLGLLFMEHGLSKYFAFPAPPTPANFQFFSIFGLAGLIEIVGGLLLTLGLYTRAAAFIMSGEMAVAYFMLRPQRSFFPILNGGDLEAVYSLFFFTFFLIGGGAWSLDRTWRRSSDRVPVSP